MAGEFVFLFRSTPKCKAIVRQWGKGEWLNYHFSSEMAARFDYIFCGKMDFFCCPASWLCELLLATRWNYFVAANSNDFVAQAVWNYFAILLPRQFEIVLLPRQFEIILLPRQWQIKVTQYECGSQVAMSHDDIKDEICDDKNLYEDKDMFHNDDSR